ncbi:UvrD-helicase domain-containing protein [Mesorhizobium sp. M0243]|uniref:UvrD-helicase domain-containing protein n=1 Tax=Mesorhizobium sp. M0243 TaxID=2956925 RepID=UPI0033375D94
MRVLPNIVPTPEQLPIISANRLGIEVIRGAAGSGKTSTAILRLRSLAYMFEARRTRQENDTPVRLLVLTFNRTLAGYIRALTEDQVEEFENTDLEINTFAKWSIGLLGGRNIISDTRREQVISGLARTIPLAGSYVVKEVDYLLGRFEPDGIESYLTVERTGRGTEPRVDRALRRRLLDEVVYPYKEWLNNNNLFDWNDIAVEMAQSRENLEYDIVIVDESQDFSANQLRAIRHHIADEFAVTFVIDTAQRIYARGFTWAETGFDMQGARYHTLRANHRNTVQITAFAAGILAGLAVEEDGALPRLESATRQGPLPVILKGRYDPQVEWRWIIFTKPSTLKRRALHS